MLALYTYTQHLPTRPLDARIDSFTTGVTFIYFHMKIGAVSRLGTGHPQAPRPRRPRIADAAGPARRARAVPLGVPLRVPPPDGGMADARDEVRSVEGRGAARPPARRFNARCRVLAGGRSTWRSAEPDASHPASPSCCITSLVL